MNLLENCGWNAGLPSFGSHRGAATIAAAVRSMRVGAHLKYDETLRRLVIVGSGPTGLVMHVADQIGVPIRIHRANRGFGRTRTFAGPARPGRTLEL